MTTTPIIDPATQKAIKEIEDLKREIWMQAMDVYLCVPKTMFLYKIPERTKPSKWRRFKAWIKNKLEWINRL